MSAAVALVLVSHSTEVARGLVEVAEQMAPDVVILAAGGTDDDRVGTSYERVDEAVSTAQEADGVEAVAILTDLGSATLTAEAVVDGHEGEPVAVVPGPFVEGAVAGAVAAQLGGDLDQVRRAVADAAGQLAREAGALAEEPAAEAAPASGGAEGAPTRTVVLRNRLGLHARPASLLAREARAHDAAVRVNGVPADDVLELMGLGLEGGASLHLSATGPEALVALDALAALVGTGFGEE